MYICHQAQNLTERALFALQNLENSVGSHCSTLHHSKMTTAMFIVRCRHRHHSQKSPVCGTRKDQYAIYLIVQLSQLAVNCLLPSESSENILLL